jgi:hypothetical protein
MAKTVEPVAETPKLPLDDFLHGIPPVMARGFRVTVEGANTPPQTQEGWQQLYELYRTKPGNVPWATWVKSKNGGNK